MVSVVTVSVVAVAHALAQAKPLPWLPLPWRPLLCLVQAKPTYGYGTAIVRAPAPRSLAECEARCCGEPTCHSVSWRAGASECVAMLSIAHGARPTDWCWRPTLAPDAVTSIRLAGAWEQRALAAAARVLGAQTLLRVGNASGPRLYRKAGRHWTSPAGHTHPLERSIEPSECAAPPRGGGGRAGAVEVSDLVIAAIPVGDPRPKKPRGVVELAGCPATFLRQAHPNAGTHPAG